mgnify:CR=1 FL=1
MPDLTNTRFEAVSGFEGSTCLTLLELPFRFFRSVFLLKTSYSAGPLAYSANAGYTLRHAYDSLTPLLATLRDTVRRSTQITKITPPWEYRWKQSISPRQATATITSLSEAF